MAIFLDTNILPQRGTIRNHVALAAVLQIAKIKGIPVKLPSLVIEESVNMRKEAAGKAFEALQNALAASSRYFDFEPVYIPLASEVAKAWREDLTSTFEIAEVNPGDAVEALRREALRIAPARNGKGSRDCAIWLTIHREHMTASRPTYFVSDNALDFGIPKTDELNPSLKEELGEKAHNFHYFRNIDQLLAHFAEKTEYTVAVEHFTPFYLDVIDAFSVELAHAPIDIDVSTPEDVEIKSIDAIKVRRAYRIDEKILVLVEVDLEVHLIGEDINTPTATTRTKMRAWLEFDESSNEPEAISIDTVEIRRLEEHPVMPN